MADEACTITIDGTYAGEYYVSCNSVQYIEDGTLYNLGSSTIYLYASKNSSGYPRIQCPSLAAPRYYASSGSSYVGITDITTTDFNIYSQIYRFNDKYFSVIVTFLVCLIALIKLFRRK